MRKRPERPSGPLRRLRRLIIRNELDEIEDWMVGGDHEVAQVTSKGSV